MQAHLFSSIYCMNNGLTDFFKMTAYYDSMTAYSSPFSLKEKDIGAELSLILPASLEFSYLG